MCTLFASAITLPEAGICLSYRVQKGFSVALLHVCECVECIKESQQLTRLRVDSFSIPFVGRREYHVRHPVASRLNWYSEARFWDVLCRNANFVARAMCN